MPSLASTMDHDVSPISSPSLSRVNSRNSAVSSLDISPISSPVEPSSRMGTHSDSITTPSFDTHSFDAEDWFGRFRDDVDVSDDCPDRAVLAAAGDIPVYDVNGNARYFKTLYTGLDAIGDRQMIIFVRHFYCGACQAYMKALTEEITMQAYYTMAVPTSIVVIGCGSPALIPHWKKVTGCPFPIFAEPSRKLYKRLGMTLTFDLSGPKRPDYMKDIPLAKWQLEQWKDMAKVRGSKKFKGGNLFQTGGEFLFQDGQAVWCHRMKNMRGHSEVVVIKRILEIE